MCPAHSLLTPTLVISSPGWLREGRPPYSGWCRIVVGGFCCSELCSHDAKQKSLTPKHESGPTSSTALIVVPWSNPSPPFIRTMFFLLIERGDCFNRVSLSRAASSKLIQNSTWQLTRSLTIVSLLSCFSIFEGHLCHNTMTGSKIIVAIAHPLHSLHYIHPSRAPESVQVNHTMTMRIATSALQPHLQNLFLIAIRGPSHFLLLPLVFSKSLSLSLAAASPDVGTRRQ